jgi:hypothetical protein
MSIDLENSYKAIKHINEMKFGCQISWYLYSNASSVSKFGDIGFNFKALQGCQSTSKAPFLTKSMWKFLNK